MTATTAGTVGLTRALAEFLSDTAYGDLPSSVVDECYRATLDWLGSALAGALEPPARIAQRVARGLGSSDESTVFGAGRGSAAAAALANGVASHIVELDDVHKGSTLHAAAPVISAALAVAERERAPGRAFARASRLDTTPRFALERRSIRAIIATGTPPARLRRSALPRRRGSLLGLTSAQMLDALGTAGTQAAGLWEFNADGAMSKHLHPGKAAFNGVLAADLARLGFTGATRILEGERGFFRATAAGFDPSRVTDRLGEQWKITENCYKLHSCCAHTHTAIDVALDIRARRGWTAREALDAIARIDLETYRAGIRHREGTQSIHAVPREVQHCLLHGGWRCWRERSAWSSSRRIDSETTASSSRRSPSCCRAFA
jgi:2-methylcitrate dehydratase PrpD